MKKMALKLYDTMKPQGNFPLVEAKDVLMPDGTRLSDKGETVTVDQTYNSSSKNAQSGKAVAEAIREAIGQALEGDY